MEAKLPTNASICLCQPTDQSQSSIYSGSLIFLLTDLFTGQLNLAIPLWVGAMSTTERSGVKRHTTHGLATYKLLMAKETEISA